MPFHLWSTDTPEYIEKVLPIFGSGNTYTNKELAENTPDSGATDNIRRLGHLTQFWYTLGLLDRKKDGSTYYYSLSKFGESTLSLLNFNKSLCFDLLHYALLNAWIQDQHENWGWSWVYKTTTDLLWESDNQEIENNIIHAQVMEIADVELSDWEAKVDPVAMTTTANWLARLSPPFLIRDSEDESSKSIKYRVVKREYCNPELMLLAVALEYHYRELPFGTPMVMDENTITNVCRVCLLDPSQFWPVIDLAAITFANYLHKKDTLYGTSVALLEQPDHLPPNPRRLDDIEIVE